MLPYYFVLRGAVSCWNSFHNKLKNPAVALDAAHEAAGFLCADVSRGAVQLLRWACCVKPVPAGLGGVCIQTRVGEVDPLWKLREKTACWKFKYSGSEDEWGRATELTFPHSHFIDREM